MHVFYEGIEKLADFLEALDERILHNNLVNIGLVGAGKMGEAIIHQAMIAKGLRLAAVAEINLSRASSVLKDAGQSGRHVKISNDGDVLSRAIESGMTALTSDASRLIELPHIDVVIDATGEVEVGATLGYNAIMNQKCFVMMNAEADATVGPLLSKQAHIAGTVYTGDLGDEPGTTMHFLYEPFKSLGFQVIAAGKGKNNPLDIHATPTTLNEEATRKRLNPHILTSFVDGTKTMVEMTILSNATGLTPDIRGMHGPKAQVAELHNYFKDKKHGGILGKEGVVDYVIGIAPGVFIVVDTADRAVKENLSYLKVGEGPPYAFYRPYHLPGTETVLTAIWAANFKRPIIHAKGHISDVITCAKQDLEKGAVLDGIGGHTSYGSIETNKVAKKDNLLPLGLSKGATVKRAVKRDQVITFDDVEILEDQLVYRLWRLQEKTFG
ncbi:MAG: NAD(P)H-dependent oxidoreductase [Candidatus Hodarchaeota archaeon]